MLNCICMSIICWYDNQDSISDKMEKELELIKTQIHRDRICIDKLKTQQTRSDKYYLWRIE